jgi:signal transduction histidine kinase
VALQAGVAEYVLSSDPTAARTAIVNAGAAGREAINDLGRVLDALRDTSDPAPMQPQPVLAELPRLVDRFKTSGVEVTLVVTDAEDVPPSVQMTAFRIVQEALTNVVKHVGPSARAEVTVDRCQDRLVVEVRDFGSALASRKATGSGLGLHNMRERAALVGGTLRAGPSATGFLVQLVIPLGAGVHGQYALQKR